MLVVLLWSWLKVAFKSGSIKAKQSQLKENLEERDRNREGGSKESRVGEHRQRYTILALPGWSPKQGLGVLPVSKE